MISREDRWGAQLAGELLVESADFSANISEANQVIHDNVVAWLKNDLMGGTFPAIERATAGRSLAVLGDPRQEVHHTRHMDFCWVPAGPFWMGGDQSDQLGNDYERVKGKAHRVEMPDGYWMGRYPVTQAQFAEFVADGGYGRAVYWRVAEVMGRWSDGWVTDHDVYGGERRQTPADYGKPYALPNHPVVGITWYEMLAYAAWATEQLKTAGRLPEGWHITLPSEAQWEKAARGGIQLPSADVGSQRVSAGVLAGLDSLRLIEQPAALAKRRYPWGEEPDPDRANYNETKVGSTSAVGCFPGGASVYGCEDMSGNVWEWTRSRSEDYPYPYPSPGAKRDSREDLAGGDARLRVLRGGAFSSPRWGARCAARLRDYPRYRDPYVGFRLAASPFHSDL